jgi:hypothetical protein
MRHDIEALHRGARSRCLRRDSSGDSEAAFLPVSPNVPAYIVLLVFTLPVSIVAMPVLFVTIGVTFSDSRSVWLRLLTIVLWMGCVAIELLALRGIQRARGRRRSLSA